MPQLRMPGIRDEVAGGILELDVGVRASDTQHQRRCPTGDGVFVSHAESISRLLDINVGSGEQRVCLQVSPIPADVRSETGQHANAQVHSGAESSSKVRIGKVLSGKQDAGSELEPHTILGVGHTWCGEQDGSDDSEKDCLHDDGPICASKAATTCVQCAPHAAVRRFNARPVPLGRLRWTKASHGLPKVWLLR